MTLLTPTTGWAGSSGAKNLKQIIEGEGEESGLLVVLDAGDSSSYSGSGQTWSNLVSGAGTDFYRGADGSAGSDDPTFNGTAGGLSESEYWSFDGGDFFQEVTSAWGDDPFHKDNATFTLLAIHWPVSGSGQGLFGNGFNSGASFYLSIDATKAYLTVRRAPSANALVADSGSASHTTSAINFMGMSLDEAAGSGGLRWQINNSTDSDTSTYTSPTGSNASHAFAIGAIDPTTNALSNGARVYAAAIWNRAIGASALSSLYTACKTRWSSLP